MKNIILATDFSDNARNSIVYAIELFGEIDVEYTLVNAFKEPQINKDILITIRDILEKRSIDGLQSDYEFIQNRFPEKSLKIEQKSGYGKLSKIVNELAQKKMFNYVVMGTKGKTASWYIGSEAKDMAQKSKVPVLVIPENAKYKHISKIVYATDLMEDESFLINELLVFAEAHQAHVTMLHIDPNTANSLWSINELKEIVEKSNYNRVMFEELIAKNVEDAIIKYSEENDIDFLALTTYTTLLLKRLFHKSLARQMLLNSKIPLLVYNRKNYDYIFLG